MRKVGTVRGFLRFQHLVRAGTWKRVAALSVAIMLLWGNYVPAANAAEAGTTAVTESTVEDSGEISDTVDEAESDSVGNEPDKENDVSEPAESAEMESADVNNAIGGLGGGVRVSGDKDSITQDSAGNGIHVRKTLSNMEDGQTLQVRLESYTTGQTEKQICPADIVLCVDVSGSMIRTFSGNENNIEKLKKAANYFIDELAAQNANLSPEEQSRLALVQYGDSGESGKLTDLLYVTDDTNVSELHKKINGLDPKTAHKTNMDIAMESAQKILDGDELSGRDKVVVVFTDGVPSGDAHDEEGFARRVANGALAAAKKMKESGVKVYAFSIEAHANNNYDLLPDYEPKDKDSYIAEFYQLDAKEYPVNILDPQAINLENRYMFLLSSAFPHAEDIDTPNAENNDLNITEEQKKYYSTTESTEGLKSAFQAVAKSIVKTSSEFGSQAEARDFITPEFELADQNEVKVYTADYLGNDTWAEPGSSGWSDITDELQEKKEIKIEAGSESDNYVKVSGFDYKANYVSNNVDGEPHGEKLIITFPIRSRKTFGGNQIATNEADSGVYESDKADAKAAVTYPVPHADLELNYSIRTEDRLVYVPDLADLTGSVPFTESHTPDGKRNQYVKIQYSVMDPTIEETSDSDGNIIGTLTIDPGKTAEECSWDWKKPAASECGFYKVTCDVIPTETGHYETIRLNDIVNVHVLHPAVLFKDSVLPYGSPVDTAVKENEFVEAEDMQGHRVSLNWVCQDNCKNPKTVPETESTTPHIQYRVSIPRGVEDVNGQKIIATTEDIPVVVGIFRISDASQSVDLSGQTEFFQQCERGENCGYKTVLEKGDPVGARFLIHVTTNPIPELPSTGGSGTGGYLAAAIAMASMLSLLKAYQRLTLRQINEHKHDF